MKFNCKCKNKHKEALIFDGCENYVTTENAICAECRIYCQDHDCENVDGKCHDNLYV